MKFRPQMCVVSLLRPAVSAGLRFGKQSQPEVTCHEGELVVSSAVCVAVPWAALRDAGTPCSCFGRLSELLAEQKQEF